MIDDATHLHYRLMVRGLFGRNRKPKFDVLDLGVVVPVAEPRSLDSLRPLVRDKLGEIRAKPGLAYTLREEPVTIEETEIGGRVHRTEGFVLMSEKVLLKGVVGGEEVVPEATSP